MRQHAPTWCSSNHRPVELEPLRQLPRRARRSSSVTRPRAFDMVTHLDIDDAGIERVDRRDSWVLRVTPGERLDSDKRRWHDHARRLERPEPPAATNAEDRRRAHVRLSPRTPARAIALARRRLLHPGQSHQPALRGRLPQLRCYSSRTFPRFTCFMPQEGPVVACGCYYDVPQIDDFRPGRPHAFFEGGTNIDLGRARARRRRGQPISTSLAAPGAGLRWSTSIPP